MKGLIVYPWDAFRAMEEGSGVVSFSERINMANSIIEAMAHSVPPAVLDTGVGS